MLLWQHKWLCQVKFSSESRLWGQSDGKSATQLRGTPDPSLYPNQAAPSRAILPALLPSGQLMCQLQQFASQLFHTLSKSRSWNCYFFTFPSSLSAGFRSWLYFLAPVASTGSGLYSCLGRRLHRGAEQAVTFLRTWTSASCRDRLMWIYEQG